MRLLRAFLWVVALTIGMEKKNTAVGYVEKRSVRIGSGLDVWTNEGEMAKMTLKSSGFP